MRFILLIVLITSSAWSKDQAAPLKETLSAYSEVLSNPTPHVSCGEEDSSAFCSDPYKAICSDLVTHRNAQLSRTEALGKNLPENQQYVSPKASDLKTSFQEVLKYMQETIAASQITPTEKNDFDALLQRTTIKTASQIRQELGSKASLTEKERLIYYTVPDVCGDKNTNPKAVNFDADGEQRTNDPIVVVCDGLLDSLPPNSPGSLTDRIFMVVAHELSHSFSAHWYPATYQSLRQCLTNESGPSVQEDYKKAFADQMEPGEKIPTAPQLVGAMLEEAGCDFWAKKAFARYLKANSGETLRKLRQSYGYFCGASYSGSHPSGKFRIEMVGKDSEIRKLMGCAVPAKKDGIASTCKI